MKVQLLYLQQNLQPLAFNPVPMCGTLHFCFTEKEYLRALCIQELLMHVKNKALLKQLNNQNFYTLTA